MSFIESEPVPRIRLTKLLGNIREGFDRILGDQLTGLYLHGSIAFGCFRWEVSDVDFLAVVSSPLTLGEKTQIIRMLLDLTPDAPPKGIEMSVVTEDACRRFVHPAPYELHFSNAHIESYRADPEGYCQKLCGCDPDLAAHFAVTREVGQALCGRPIEDVFAPVPREAVLDSIRADVAEADMGENPVYFALNLCRVLAYQEEGRLLSKQDGGEWGLKNLPEIYHPVVCSALAVYTQGGEIAPKDALDVFCEYAKRRIFGGKCP